MCGWDHVPSRSGKYGGLFLRAAQQPARDRRITWTAAVGAETPWRSPDRRASPFAARSGQTKVHRLGRIGESIINPGLRSAAERARRTGRGRPKVHFIWLRGATLFCLQPSAPELLLFGPQAPIRTPQKAILPLQRFEP
ncbi:hypothetical protein VTN00DRAFT_4635 [Thermoascus crustaceus]|uniref:uncharacterized protein n=1 Tax=Thermoascus crustaceus TaxID=5088 RepID=UPI0037438CC8